MDGREDKTPCIRIARSATDIGTCRVSYRVMIGGCEFDTFCVGEARASLINNRYFLEMTKDNRPPYSSYDREDHRQFEMIGSGIVDEQHEAEKELHLAANSWAKYVSELSGLKIIDLTKKIEEAPRKDEEPISADDKI